MKKVRVGKQKKQELAFCVHTDQIIFPVVFNICTL